MTEIVITTALFIAFGLWVIGDALKQLEREK